MSHKMVAHLNVLENHERSVYARDRAVIYANEKPITPSCHHIVRNHYMTHQSEARRNNHARLPLHSLEMPVLLSPWLFKTRNKVGGI